MTREGKARLFRRADGKYMVYIPVDFAEDSAFPFKNWQPTRSGPGKRSAKPEANSIPLHVVFESNPPRLILTEPN